MNTIFNLLVSILILVGFFKLDFGIIGITLLTVVSIVCFIRAFIKLGNVKTPKDRQNAINNIVVNGIASAISLMILLFILITKSLKIFAILFLISVLLTFIKILVNRLGKNVFDK